MTELGPLSGDGLLSPPVIPPLRLLSSSLHLLLPHPGHLSLPGDGFVSGHLSVRSRLRYPLLSVRLLELRLRVAVCVCFVQAGHDASAMTGQGDAHLLQLIGRQVVTLC